MPVLKNTQGKPGACTRRDIRIAEKTTASGGGTGARLAEALQVRVRERRAAVADVRLAKVAGADVGASGGGSVEDVGLAGQLRSGAAAADGERVAAVADVPGLSA